MELINPFNKIWAVTLAIWVYLSFSHTSTFTVTFLFLNSLSLIIFNSLLDKAKIQGEKLNRRDEINSMINNKIFRRAYYVSIPIGIFSFISFSSILYYSLFFKYTITNHILLILSIISILYFIVSQAISLSGQVIEFISKRRNIPKWFAKSPKIFSFIACFLVFVLISGISFLILYFIGPAN